MKPVRSQTIGGILIEELYIANQYIVYVDNIISGMTFEEAIEYAVKCIYSSK